MLSKEDNEILCRVGPGTPMGNLMRQYWVPAVRSDELASPDCPPMRWKLLGEELIAFRTPPLPDLEANMLAAGEYAVGNLMRDCNWMQALEGDIDTVHVAFLHGGHRTVQTTPPGTTGYYTARERAARYEMTDAEYGVSYGAYRSAEDDSYYLRIAHFLF